MHIHDGIPVIFGHFEEQVITQHSRIIDQDVKASKVAGGFINGILHHGAIGDIAV